MSKGNGERKASATRNRTGLLGEEMHPKRSRQFAPTVFGLHKAAVL